MASAGERTALLKYRCIMADKWSRFPAIQNVDMGCYSITNLEGATFCNGAVLDPDAINFRPTNMYYVAKNGNNTTGDGSYSKPWQTIQHAIDQLEVIPLTAATQAVINLAPGHYVENLIFTNGYIAIVSPMNANDVNEMVEIEGNVLVNITTGAADLFNKQVIFQGIQITGTVTDTSTIQHTLMLQDCYIYASGRALYQNCTVDNRTRVYNCQIGSSSPLSTDPCMEIASGDTYLERIDFDYNGKAPVLKVSGTGAAFASLCDFTSSSTYNGSDGIKIVHVTSTRGSSFGNSLFRFTNTAAKTNANGFYCLFYEPSSLPGVGIAVLYCTFIATGMNSSQNVAASTGSGTLTSAIISHGGCFSAPGLSNGSIGGNNAGIPTPGVIGVHKFPFTAVS
jgi:hypothetical protein